VFANRYTAFIDACALAGALQRNLMLTLAEAEFFRVRWSEKVLDETQTAIEAIVAKKGDPDPARAAIRARGAMEQAFEDAMVEDFEDFLALCGGLPDKKDAHVLAAALKTKADVLVTDNVKHFPPGQLAAFGVAVRTADEFIADTIMLDEGRAVPALRRMRERFLKPNLTADELLLRMEAVGLTETVDVLRPHVESL
jgi:predicted nucleic acid-binding protein